MKIYLESEEILDIQQWEINLLGYQLSAANLTNDLKRRLQYIIRHKIDQCFEQLQKDFMPILRDDPSVTSIPVKKDQFVAMILQRPDYKDRDTKEAEQQLQT